MKSFYHAAIVGLVIGLVLFIAPFVFHVVLFVLIIGLVVRLLMRKSRRKGSRYNFRRAKMNRHFNENITFPIGNAASRPKAFSNGPVVNIPVR